MKKFLYRIITLAAVLSGVSTAASAAATAQPAPQEALRFAVEQLPPAPLPGAKYRSSGRLEVFVAARLKAAASQAEAAELPHQKPPAWIGVWPKEQALPEGYLDSRLAWSVQPLVFMRTDSAIRALADLRGRSVCIGADARWRGLLAQNYGAIEDVYPSVTDALLGVRTGACDFGVLDESLAKELLRLPEWQKFSKQLSLPHKSSLSMLLAKDAPADLREALRAQFAPKELGASGKKLAQDIAFEVYLDQTVPDCH